MRVLLSSFFLILFLVSFKGTLYSQGDASGVATLELSQDSSRFATGHSERIIRIWDTATTQVLNTFQGPDLRSSSTQMFDINGLAFHPDSSKIAVSFGGTIARGLILILDTNTGQTLTEIEAGAFAGAIDWSPNGNHLAGITTFGFGSPTQANFLNIWDVQTGMLLNEKSLLAPSALSLAWSPDGSRIAYTDGPDVVIWDVVTWQEVFTLLFADEPVVTAVAWSPDGNRLATTGMNFVRVWDVTTGQQLIEFAKSDAEQGNAPLAVWSADGSQVVSTAFTMIEAWNVDTGQPTLSVDVGGRINGLIWRPDGVIMYGSGTVQSIQTAPPLTPTPSFLTVTIDIKPGSFPNSINLGSGGNVPVAIFSTATFDATTVDPLSVTLASAPVRLRGNGTAQAEAEDVNGDGRLDLVVHVNTEALQLSPTDTEAVLEGRTTDGTTIRGVDSVRVVP